MKTEQTTASHTPGPWKVSGELENLRVSRFDSENPDSCDGIRQVAEVVQSGYEIPNYREAEANARLIAAAPELLSALEQTRDILIAYHREHQSPYADDAAQAIKQGFTAIAKAKESNSLLTKPPTLRHSPQTQ